MKKNKIPRFTTVSVLNKCILRWNTWKRRNAWYSGGLLS